MPYVVKVDGATLKHAAGDAVDPAGNKIGQEHTSVVHRAGDILEDAEIADVHKRLLDAGDKQHQQLLEQVSDSEAEKLREESSAASGPGVDRPHGSAFHFDQSMRGAGSLEEAAEAASIGPNPVEVAPTGVSAIPGLVAPDQAAEQSDRERAGEEFEAAPGDAGLLNQKRGRGSRSEKSDSKPAESKASEKSDGK